MGGVNASPRYVQEVGIGNADGTVTNTTHQGGIVSIVSSNPFYLFMYRAQPILVLPWGYIWMFCRWMGRRSHRSS